MSSIIKVLIVDDSPTTRHMLCHIVGLAPDMRVVGEAHDGIEAVTMTASMRPDIVLMDAIMPHMGGVDATREIMRRTPTPIVVISASLESVETQTAFEAVKAGALTTLKKPVGPHQSGYEAQAGELLSTLRAMAGVKVIHHNLALKPQTANLETPQLIPHDFVPKIVAVVSSTGGPAALAEIIRTLPEDFSLPIVVVQHIAPDFVSSLQLWLSQASKLKICIAHPNESPRAGHVYLAPGNVHLTLNISRRFEFKPGQTGEVYVPSGDVFLTSVSRAYQAQAVGIILTGMGADGATGLRLMYEAGAFTIAQDEASCVVYGMPREAAKLGAARQVLPLTRISETLLSLPAKGEFYEHKTAHFDR
ncbi:MAG TPA: chemotaxis-specific protein-glutamate methyltransferase CheB [Aggregatilineales bacterium]|nr:chemotaxis-specific protein-glutamate methyltransferase CheB [Aggregatilineales bacterium]